MERGTKSAKLHRMREQEIGIGAHRPAEAAERPSERSLAAVTVVSNQAHASNQRGIALHAALLLPPPVIVLNHSKSKSNPLLILQLSPPSLPLIPL